MPIVKVTNNSMKNINGKPHVTYHDVTAQEARLMFKQIRPLWLTYEICVVKKEGE